MALKLKKGVSLVGASQQILFVLQIVDGVMERSGYSETVVTSINDGTHGWGSLHPHGDAADVRTRHIETLKARAIVGEVREALGYDKKKPQGAVEDVDVLFHEPSPGKPGHLHLEFQPKVTARP